MNLTNTQFSIVDQPADCLRIVCETKLDGVTAAHIRSSIEDAMKFNYPLVYIDAKNINEADLSGINEIIHTHYTLRNVNSKLVFVYSRNSSVEKWVETTGLDTFIETAIIPGN